MATHVCVCACACAHVNVARSRPTVVAQFTPSAKCLLRSKAGKAARERGSCGHEPVLELVSLRVWKRPSSAA